MRIKPIETTSTQRGQSAPKLAPPKRSLEERVEKLAPRQNIGEKSEFDRMHEKYKENAQKVFREEKPQTYQSIQAMRGYAATANFEKKAEFAEIFKVDVVV